MTVDPVNAWRDAERQYETFCGVKRASMATNPLIFKPRLGEARKTLFNSAPSDLSFGQAGTHKAEAAGEVLSHWEEHHPNAHNVPGADFKAMNKAAVSSGLTQARQLPAFRAQHPVALKRGEGRQKLEEKRTARLPCDTNPQHTFGKPPGHRSPEVVRGYGPSEPRVAQLVQGAFQHSWVDMNAARAQEFDPQAKRIKPTATRASMARSICAAERILAGTAGAAAGRHEGIFKLSKFAGVQSKVGAQMAWPQGKAPHKEGASVAAAKQRQQQQQKQAQR